MYWDFICKPIYNGEIIYEALIENETFSDVSQSIIQGSHTYKMTDKDVDSVYIFKCNTNIIPKGIELKFPNLRILTISNSNLVELKKADLIDYRNLTQFHCINNPISFLPGDLFEEFQNLEVIVFSNNQLDLIEPDILDEFYGLKCVKFEKEVNYDLCYSSYETSGSNTTIDGIKKELKAKFLQSLQDFKRHNIELSNQNAKLTHQIKKLICLKSKVDILELEKEQLNSGLYGDLMKYLKDEKSKDVKITVDDNTFCAHKCVLASRSPTLAKHFQDRPNNDTLNLMDIDATMFDQIMKYMYTNVYPTDVNFLKLYAAAGRLQINDLMEYAAKKIPKYILKTNAVEILELSFKYDYNGLKKKAFNVLKHKYPLIKFRDEWLANSEVLGKVIQGLKKQEEAMRNFDVELQKIVK